MIQDRKKEIFFGSILPAFPLIEGYIFAYEININVSIYKTEVLFWNAFLFLKKLQKVLPPILRREKKKKKKKAPPRIYFRAYSATQYCLLKTGVPFH